MKPFARRGVALQHERGGAILLVPETENEAALHVFAELGLPVCAERGGYLASSDQLGDIVLALPYFSDVAKRHAALLKEERPGRHFDRAVKASPQRYGARVLKRDLN